MFNSVNGNPFNKKIESALSTGQENKRQQQNQQNDEDRRYLNEDDKDEVEITTNTEFSEEDVIFIVRQYIEKLKSENSEKKDVITKLDKFLAKFDAKKFMKQNPNLSYAEINMLLYNETIDLLK